jgi:hypothetical protein
MQGALPQTNFRTLFGGKTTKRGRLEKERLRIRAGGVTVGSAGELPVRVAVATQAYVGAGF